MSFVKSITSVVLVLFLCTLFYKPVEIEDVGWHLKTGEWIVENAQAPREDPFSIEDIETPWVFTQWLGSVIFYSVYKLGGSEGLKVFRVCFFLIVMGIFCLFARRKIPTSILVLLLVSMAFGLSSRALLRPFIFNYIFIQLFLIQLFAYQKSQDRKNLYILPFLGIVWFNLHLGSFLYGSMLFGIFGLVSLVQFLNAKFEKSEEGPKHLKQIIEIILTYVAFVILFVINPYGIDGALYPFKVFLLPKFINIYRFVNLISEAQPPVYLLSVAGVWFYILCFFALAGLVVSKTNRLTHTILFAVALAFYLYGDRASVFFVIVVSYVIAQTISKISFNKRDLNTICVCLMIFMVSFTANKFNQNVLIDGKSVRYNSLKYKPKNPDTAIQFLKDNNITGVVFCNDMTGGHILWRGFPNLKPLVDGRQVNQDIFAKYLDVAAWPNKFFGFAEKEFGFNVVLLDASLSTSFRLIPFLTDHPDWHLVFIDGPSVVFMKQKTSLEGQLKSVQLTSDEIELLESVKAPDTHFRFQRILKPAPAYIDTLEEGVTLLEMGYKQAGAKRIVAAYKQSDQKLTRVVMNAAREMLNQP